MFIVEFISNAYYVEGKEFIQCTIRNITERKKAEEELKESEAKYKTIFDKSTDGIIAADSKTKKFVFANKRMTKITGYSEKELLKMDEMSIYPKKDWPYVLDQFTKQLNRKIIVAKDIPVLKKDGSIAYCEVSSNMIKIKERELLLSLFRDVTEHMKSEEMKIKLESDKKIKQLKNEFLSIITHDLKQPITPIIGYAEIVKEKVEDAELKDYLDKIVSQAYNMHEMVDKILNLLRLEAGKLLIEKRSLDLKSLLDEVLEIKSSNIEVRCSCSCCNVPKTACISARKGWRSSLILRRSMRSNLSGAIPRP